MRYLWTSVINSNYLYVISDVRWQPEAVKLLVSLRVEKDYKFNMLKTHVSLWEEISKCLAEQGHTITEKQCSNKWKGLKRDYKSVIDNNSKTGSDKKSCKFYEEFNQLFGNKASTRPSFTLDTSSCSRSVSPECSASNASDSENKEMSLTDSEEPTTKKAKTPGRKIKKKESGVDRMVNFLKSYQDKQQEMQKEHEMFMKDQNNEKLKRFDKLLDIMAKK